MVFVAEKAGKILVYENVDDETPELFKDLRTEVYNHADRGLLGLAVDPAFPTKPYVYALFTYDHVLGSNEPAPEWGEPNQTGDVCPELHGADDCLVSGRLVRYTANITGTPGNLHAVAGEEKALIKEAWCQQFSSHSIGDLRFGPEGALYASGGDGASFSSPDYGQLGSPANPCGDPPDEGGSLRSQDLRTPAPHDPTGLNGSIIRIDPETGTGWPTNPKYASNDQNEKRIVAFGFRNPFRFTTIPRPKRSTSPTSAARSSRRSIASTPPPAASTTPAGPATRATGASISSRTSDWNSAKTSTKKPKTAGRAPRPNRSSTTATSRRWCPATNATSPRARRSRGSPSTRGTNSRPNTKGRSSFRTRCGTAST